MQLCFRHNSSRPGPKELQDKQYVILGKEHGVQCPLWIIEVSRNRVTDIVQELRSTEQNLADHPKIWIQSGYGTAI